MNTVNVLVVDDASFIRDLVKKCLRAALPGIVIEEAANGRKAQQLLERQTFDLVLCDWEMPEMSGLELLVWLRGQQHAAMPFIMVTSRGDKENVIQAIQAGVSDYVGKPFTSEQLVTKVKKALAGSGRLAALQKPAEPALSTGTGGDSLAVLTAGKAAAPVAAARPAMAKPAATGKSAVAGISQSRGPGMLRLPEGELACLIKALSLKEIVVMVKRGDLHPQILSSVVIDLEQGGQSSEIARLNGYVHALSAVETAGEIQWLQVHCRFVDNDPQKLDYISRMIARGTTQKHFTPGA